ncbi:MAG: hypothetical protein ABDI07_06005 [Candidatus Kryptonium sp.]
MRFTKLFFIVLLSLLFISNVFTQRKTSPAVKQTIFKYDTSLYRAMQMAEIGPFRGGRSIAVAGHLINH